MAFPWLPLVLGFSPRAVALVVRRHSILAHLFLIIKATGAASHAIIELPSPPRFFRCGRLSTRPFFCPQRPQRRIDDDMQRKRNDPLDSIINLISLSLSFGLMRSFYPSSLKMKERTGAGQLIAPLFLSSSIPPFISASLVSLAAPCKQPRHSLILYARPLYRDSS